MKNHRKRIAWIIGSAAAVIVLAVLFIVLILPGLSPAGPTSRIPPGFHVNPVDGLSPDFIMGADVSMLRQIELSGGKFYVNGVQEDALKILKDHGVNWIRLRIWNDPTDANGNGLGGGNDDLAKTVEIAVRAKKLGLKFLLDFHYSDWWADPGKQNMPKAWVGLDAAQLNQAVYAYTAQVIQALNKAGATPDMVQLGNEVNNGMLWPAGATTTQGNAPIGGYDGLANLLKQGVQAVRDNDPHALDAAKRIKIMIHLADGGNNQLYRTVFDELTARNVDFDVIGLSYYSYWHGPLYQLRNNMNDISARYHKDVVIAEASYAYTLEDADTTANLFGKNEQNTGGYMATVQGQATAIRDVIDAVAKVPDGRGLGIFYWEPDWIPVAGAGWMAGQGDTWDNQALFDFKGNALPSLNVFNLVRPGNGRTSIEAHITQLIPVAIKIAPGDPLKLPVLVQSVYSDDSIQKDVVTWDPVDPGRLNTVGAFTLNGTVAGTDLKAAANITIGGEKNFVLNPGFESGDLTSWTVDGSTGAVDVSNETQNLHSGNYALHYWLGGPFQFTLSQTITGLENGTYTFSLWIQGGGGEKTLQLFTKDCGGELKTVDVTNTGWQVWTNPTITGIPVTGGTCTVGMTVSSSGGSWAFIDDVGLSQEK